MNGRSSENAEARKRNRIRSRNAWEDHLKAAKQSICFAAMETSEMRKQFAGYLASKLQDDQTNMPGEEKKYIYQDRFMLLRYSFPSFPPHWKISWGTDNLKFSFKGLNGNPWTGDCSVSNSWVTFLPHTQHSCRSKTATMKQNSSLHPCQHFTLGLHL